MCSEKNVLKVRIFGADYSISSQENVNHIQKVAEYVDMKMREIDENVRVDSSLKIAILASMNIADELFSANEKMEELKAQFKDKIDNLNTKLDSQISDAVSNAD